MKTLPNMILILSTLGASASYAQCPPAPLSIPVNGIAFDQFDQLWVTNYQGGQVVTLAPTPLAGTYTQAAVLGGFKGPSRLAFDSTGYLYITESGAGFVDEYFTQLNKPSIWAATIAGFRDPLGIAVDGNRDMFVAENQASDVAGFVTGRRRGVTGGDVAGDTFWAPGALAVNNGILYVATNGGEVYSYAAANFIAAIPGLVPAPAVTYKDVNAGGPTGIAFDGAGNVYVSYYYTSNVVKYSPAGVPLMVINMSVSYPEGIAVDATGVIYVANAGASNITRYSPAGAELAPVEIMTKGCNGL